jgi:ferric-dicitrate binding protein FerR (iron transport regulator)
MTLMSKLGGDAECARAWEAEAVHDGRLTGDGRAAFERHARGCAQCTEELAELASIDRWAGATTYPEAGELQRRRLRGEILKRANLDALDPEGARQRSHDRRRAIVVGLALAAAATGLFVAAKRTRTHVDTTVVAAPVAPKPSYEVEDVSGASWTETKTADATHLSLRAGVASFHVEKVRAPSRFFVALPDGEIEVKGTRFVVDVDHGETRRVVVTEGVVALRLRDHGELLLVAGERWTKPESPVAIAPTTVASTSTSVAVARPTPTPAPDVRSRAGIDFAGAMESFKAGRFAESEASFAAFTRAHPGDSRCEDAMFLRAIGASRRGDVATAAARAKEYLAAYPQGLRRPQAERLVSAAQ